MINDKLPIKDFAAKIKAKYPQYKDIDDTVLTQKIIEQYPDYAESVDLTPLKKKVDGTDFSKLGGQAGSSVPQSEESQSKNKLREFLTSTKPKVQKQSVPWYSEEYKTPSTKRVEGDAILPVKEFKIADDETLGKKAYNTLMDVAYADDEDWNDPIKGLAKKTQSAPLDPEVLRINEKANKLVEQSLAPDGFEAKRLLADQLYSNAGSDNLTANMLRGKADKYEQSAQVLRGIDTKDFISFNDFLKSKNVSKEDAEKDPYWKGKYDEWIDFANNSPKGFLGGDTESGLIRLYATKHPDVAAQIKAAGIDINDPQLATKFDTAVSGAWIKAALDDEDLAAFATKENRSLLPAIQNVSNNLRERFRGYGINQVANEVSKKIVENGAYNPIAEFDTDKRRDYINSVAEDLYKNDPQSLKIWQEDVRPNMKELLDQPNFLGGFADAAKGFFGGWNNTLSNPSISQSIKEQWLKDATHVSADPKGFLKNVTDIGHTLGFVASLGAGGELLGLVKGAKAANAINIAGSMWGDSWDLAVAKYPNNPVKAGLSAALNTGYMTFLIYSDLLPVQKAKDLLKGIEPETGKIVEDLTNGKITREAARLKSQTLLKKSINTLGTGLKENTKISLEMAGGTFLNNVFDEVTGLSEESKAKYNATTGQTFSSMFMSNSALAGLIGFGKVQARNKMLENNLYSAAVEPKRFLRELDEAVAKNPNIKADEIRANIDFVSKEAQRLRAEGVEERNIPRFLSESVQKKIKADKIKASPESNANGLLQNSIKRHDEIMQGILEGKDHETIVTTEEQKAKDEELKKQAEQNKLYEKGKTVVQKRLDEVDADGKPVLKGGYREAAKADPEGFLREIADQIFSYSRNDKGLRVKSNLEAPDEKSMVDRFGADIVNAAKEMFPDKGAEAEAAKPAEELFPEGNEVPGETKDVHEERGFNEKSGDIDVTGKTEELPQEKPTAPTEPSEEQQLKDAREGNLVTFTYKSDAEVPEIFKDKISSKGVTNGEEVIRVTIPKSLADYHLSQEQKQLPNETTNPKAKTPAPTGLGEGGGDVGYLDVNDITKIENGKSIFSSIYKNRKEGDVFRGVEGGNLIPDNTFFVSENPLVAKEYTRAENTSGKFGRVNDKYGKNAKFQRYSISKDAKILDAKTIEGVNELRKILGLEPTDKFYGGAFKVYHLLDGISKEDAQKIKDAGYDAVRLYESDRDTGMSSVDGDSIAILNNGILKENPLKTVEQPIPNETPLPEANTENKQSPLPPKEEVQPNETINKEGEATGQEPPPSTPEPPTRKPGDVASNDIGDVSGGITHAANEVRRKERLMPEYERTPETFEQWNNEAENALKNGYDVDALMDKIKSDPKYVPTPVENAIRKIYVATLDAEIAKNPTDALLKRQMEFIQLGDLANSRAGKSLVSLKGQGNPLETISDFYVAKMEANGVDRLTENQKEEVKKQFEEIQKRAEVAEAKVADMEAKMAEMEAQKEVTKASRTKTGTRKTHEERVKDRSDAIAAAREALKKIRTGESGLGVSIPIARELAAIAPHVKKVVESYVGEGIDNLKEIVSKVYDEFKDIVPGATQKDFHDIIAGEYSERKYTRSEIAQKMRDLSDEAKLLNKLDALLRGEEPKSENKRIERNRKIKALQDKIADVKEFNKDLENVEKEAKDYKSPELKNIEKLIKKNKEATEKIKEKIRNKDFAEKPKPTSIYSNPELKKKYPKEYNQMLDALAAKEDAQHNYDIALLRDKEKQMNVYQKTGKFFKMFVATTKALKAGIDFSGSLVQNFQSLSKSPKTWAKGNKEAMMQLFSEKRYRRYLTELHNNAEAWDLMTKSELSMTDPASLRQENREEAFSNSAIDNTFKIKGKSYNIGRYTTKPFERHYSSLGNFIRADLFLRGAEKLMNEGKTFENAPEEYKALAASLNNLTGRGKLHKKIESASDLVTLGIWSPRLMASRLNALGLSDIGSIFTGKKGYYAGLTPRQRKIALYDLTKMVGSGMMTLLVFGIAGYGVDLDPESVTFGTIKLGNYRLNVFDGFSKYVKTIVQGVRGSKKVNGVREEANRWATVDKFFRGSLTPAAGTLRDVLSKKDYSNKPITWKGELTNLTSPMSAGMLYNSIERDGAVGLAVGFGNMFGLPISDERDFEFSDIPKDFKLKDPKTFKERPPSEEEYNEYKQLRDEESQKLMEKYEGDRRNIYIDVNDNVHITDDGDSPETKDVGKTTKLKLSELSDDQRKQFDSKIKTKAGAKAKEKVEKKMTD